jgi:hypothetical protein
MIWAWIGFVALALASLLRLYQRSKFDAEMRDSAAEPLRTTKQGLPRSASADQATIHIYRVPSIVGITNTQDIYCDNIPVTSLKNARRATFVVAPGEHVISLQGGTKSFRLNVATGQKYYVRSGVSLAGGFLEPTNAERAGAEMEVLKPMGSAAVNVRFRLPSED